MQLRIELGASLDREDKRILIKYKGIKNASNITMASPAI